MSAATMQQIAAQVRTLPRLPTTTLRLVSVLCNPASTMSTIVSTIRFDPSVVAEVLRLSNSAHFGLARRVTSVEDAIRFLGTAKVLQLVMAAHTQTLLYKPQSGYGLPPGALWVHSVGVALGCQLLARRFQLEEVGVLFTAGLLHDVGKTLLNEFVAQEYAEIVRRVSEEALSFSEAEEQVLGFTHAQLGAQVAESWQLPEAIVRCIRYHHEPELATPPDDLVDTVHLADCIGLLMGVGGGDDGLSYRAEPAALARHGLGEHDLEEIGAEMVVELKGVQSLFAEQ